MKFEGLFSGTDLATDTISVYGSGVEGRIRHYYTPHRLFLWTFGVNDNATAERLAIHEFAHIVDMFLTDRRRLLTPNFGYKSIVQGAWPFKAIQNEIRVIAYQKNMVDYINGSQGGSVEFADLKVFFDILQIEPHMTFPQLRTMFESFQDIPGYYLVRYFNQAMKYIKENR